MGFGFFFGDRIKILREKLKLGEGVTIHSINIDPTVSGLDVPDGDVAISTLTKKIYVKTTGAPTVWDELQSSADLFIIEKFTLNSTDISNKYVTLSSAPLDPSLTIMGVLGGVEQEYGVDFTVTGSQLSWNGTFLDGVLVSGDKLTVQHN
jgi:hypothetical protein